MNTALLQVVPVTQEDYSQWYTYWLGYQNFYKVILTEEITQTTWQRFFDDSEPVFCAVAKKGKQVLGFVHYVFHRSTWAPHYYCYLEDLYVSPDCRGQHIGKSLIEYVQQQAKTQHATRLYWHTQENNLTAQKLYNWVAEKSEMIQYRMPIH
ncbi:GNAT family N-acetyltransferase [Acinetobacter baylyi]|uniref:GNAT family N-acetyltransferase n=1 Tax=Acinetobacter baylyi TaxID=202950 RepID=UPI000EA38086|nr:GNAT family N-acetyltransferase [Acinetobacter baylyi]